MQQRTRLVSDLGLCGTSGVSNIRPSKGFSPACGMHLQSPNITQKTLTVRSITDSGQVVWIIK